MSVRFHGAPGWIASESPVFLPVGLSINNSSAVLLIDPYWHVIPQTHCLMAGEDLIVVLNLTNSISNLST